MASWVNLCKFFPSRPYPPSPTTVPPVTTLSFVAYNTMSYSAQYYDTSSSLDPWQAALQCFPDQKPATYAQVKGYQQAFQVARDPLGMEFGYASFDLNDS